MHRGSVICLPDGHPRSASYLANIRWLVQYYILQYWIPQPSPHDQLERGTDAVRDEMQYDTAPDPASANQARPSMQHDSRAETLL